MGFTCLLSRPKVLHSYIKKKFDKKGVSSTIKLMNIGSRYDQHCMVDTSLNLLLFNTKGNSIESCPCYYLHIIDKAESLHFHRIAKQVVLLMKRSFEKLSSQKLAGYDTEAVMKMLNVFQEYAHEHSWMMAEYQEILRLVTMSGVERVKILGIERGVVGYPDVI